MNTPTRAPAITLAQLESLAHEHAQAFTQHTQGLIGDIDYQTVKDRLQAAIDTFNAQNHPRGIIKENANA